MKRISLISLLFTACSTQLDPQAYMTYVEDSDAFATEITRNGITSKVAYRPGEYFAARDMVYSGNASIEEVRERYSNSLYFMLAVQHEDGTPLGIPGEYLDPMGSPDDQSIVLVSREDTIPPVHTSYDVNPQIPSLRQRLVVFARENVPNLNKATLIARDLHPHLGTIEIPVRKIAGSKRRLKGYN